MVVPDFEAIIEIELSAEGFIAAKILAHKFITLFLLSKELLSKQTHYDWGLRAIKGILRIAGGMKRGEPDKQEIQILMRALRDVNLPKFVQADFGVFLGLILDLFPKVDAPSQSDAQLTEGVLATIADPQNTLVRDDQDVFVAKVGSLAELLTTYYLLLTTYRLLLTTRSAPSPSSSQCATASSCSGRRDRPSRRFGSASPPPRLRSGWAAARPRARASTRRPSRQTSSMATSTRRPRSSTMA